MNVLIALEGTHFLFLSAQQMRLARVLKFRLYRQRTTKMLISLRGCAGWSASLLFANGINMFSHDVALYIFWKFTVCYLLIAKCKVWKWWQISYLSLWVGFKRLHLFFICENAKTDWYDILCKGRSLIFNTSMYRIKCSCQNVWILSPFKCMKII